MGENFEFGPSVEDLREMHEEKTAGEASARRRRIAAHEAAGGKPILHKPVVAAGDFVSGEDIDEMQLFEDYRAEGRS